VLLHGRGVHMYDLIPLAEELDPERRLVAVTPQAPLELAPGSFHWYVVERVGYPHPESFWQSHALLAQFLEDLPDLVGVPLSRTVLGGFSQGGVMSYALGAGEGRPRPAALTIFSSFIPEVDDFELAADLQGFPVSHAHGTLDPIISIEFGRLARDLLQDRGAELLYRESPIPHTIDPAVVDEVRPWVTRVLA